MTQKFKDILLVGSLITTFILILMFKECKDVVETVKYQSDTVTTHTSDTIWAKDTLYSYRLSPVVVDSIFIHQPDGTLCNYIREYRDTIVDSNLVIYTESLVQGKLIESGLSYKLKIPVKIVDSVKTIITNIKQEKYSLTAGFQGGNRSYGPYLDFNKNKVNVGLSYDLYNKSPQLRLGYKFYSK